MNITEDIQIPELYNRKSHINQGDYYLGNNPNDPQIGDLRVKFEVIYSKEIISVIAKQVDSHLSAYRVKQVDLPDDFYGISKHFFKEETKEAAYIELIELLGYGAVIELLEYGAVDAKKMFFNARIKDFTRRLPARISIFFPLFIGIYIAFVVLGRFERLLPFISRLVEWSRNWISLAFVAIAVYFITLAFFWLMYMPILAIILIAIAMIFLGFLKFIHQLQEVPQLLLEPILNPERVIPHKKING